MRALVWEAPRVMNMRTEPEPEVAPDEICIKVSYAGICGSELGGYLGHNALRVPPLIMGHEFAGEVVATGADVPVLDLASDKLVTVNPLIYCGTCAYCQRGLNQLCSNRRLIGAHRPGAFAEYVAVPAQQVSPLPEGMTARIGALTEPVACGVRIGELAGDVVGETCLIIGAGPIGLLGLQTLLLNGAKQVYIAELDEARLAMGEALGGIPINGRDQDTVQIVKEATNGLGAAVTVDAVGTAGTRQQCIAATRATGLMLLSGLHEETSAMPAADIIRREIVVKGSFAYTPANFATALDLLAADKIRLDPWITEAPLPDGGKWFDRLIDAPGDVSKVLLVP